MDINNDLNLVELYNERSTNGRWGVSIVGPKNTEFPCRGTLRHIGTAANISTYVLTLDDTIEQWVLPLNRSVKVHAGASVVLNTDLQSGRYAAVVILGKQAVIETYGYKARSSDVRMYINGVEKKVPPSVLLAAGLLVTEKNEVLEIPIPEPLEGAMAAAFAALK